jgi:3D (Asp-Asp-Asp) domain-containing protein
VVALAGLALSSLVPGASGAGPTERADALRRQQATLSDRSHSALLGLYSLDARLAQARTRLASLQARAAAVRDEQKRVAREEAVAKRAWRSSVRALSHRLLRLYEQGEPDSISVLLGSTSLDDAASRLDAFERSARLSNQTALQARSAQHELARVHAALALQAANLRHLVAQARAAEASLAHARAERAAYLTALRRRLRLKASEIARLTLAAREIAARAQTVAAQAAVASEADPGFAAPAGGGRTLSVTATGYSLRGRTSTGMPAGWGVVSVDPSVIPLGTRISIPGYGAGVAADTGGGVEGTIIDLWFPTRAQALAWGRRTVTIGLH